MKDIERTKEWIGVQRRQGTAVGRILDTVSPFVSADKLAAVLVEFAAQEQEPRDVLNFEEPTTVICGTTGY
jgi:hypothetical protein